MTKRMFVWLMIISNVSSLALSQFPSKVVYQKSPEKFLVRHGSTTKYAWTGNPMANGEYPYPGAVAVSDRKIRLGSQVEVNGKRYVVKDYTADWVGKKRGFTVDIYSTESKDAMLAYGRKPAEIKIYED